MGKRVLVIEDNLANLELMVQLLKAGGCEVLRAADGVEEIAATLRERPDLVVCDVQLPRCDGYEVARRVKADPLTRAIPLIAVSAVTTACEREQVLAAGFDGYLVKPITPETFVQRVLAYVVPRPGSAAGPTS
ncbi:MAG: response regulator [Planctomycetota bacterium]